MVNRKTGGGSFNCIELPVELKMIQYLIKGGYGKIYSYWSNVEYLYKETSGIGTVASVVKTSD